MRYGLTKRMALILGILFVKAIISIALVVDCPTNVKAGDIIGLKGDHPVRAKRGPEAEPKEIAPEPESEGIPAPIHYVMLMREVEEKRKLLLKKEEELKDKEDQLKKLQEEIIDSLNELKSKREELAAVEERLKQQIEEWEARKKSEEEERITQLAKVYESTSPEKGGYLLSQLEPKMAARILLKMNSRKAGKLWGFVDSKKAALISKELVNLRR